MKRAMFVGATLAAMSVGSAAMATEHTILVMPDAYFPGITYLDPGDTVRFINTTNGTREIVGKNDAWTLQIAAQSEAVMVIDQGVQKTFYDADSLTQDGIYLVEGVMSFSAPPVD